MTTMPAITATYLGVLGLLCAFLGPSGREIPPR